jgi:hypothetical protein
MVVLNTHYRTLNVSRSKVAAMVATIASENDQIWPLEQWPAMRFKEGMKPGSKGGHGPIRYTIEVYDPKALVQFRFRRPHGFDGIHKLELNEMQDEQTEIVHTIAMNTSGRGTLLWIFAIRPLHDALIEDAFDKLENQLHNESKSSPWSLWVKFLRWVLAK